MKSTISNSLYIEDGNGEFIRFNHPSQLTMCFTDKNGKPIMGVIIPSQALIEIIDTYMKSLSKDA